MMQPRRLLLLLAALASPAAAINMVVVDARGGGFKPGQMVAASAIVALKEGERATLISPDGRSVTLHGPYNGVVLKAGTAVQDPRAALAALISTRNDRAKSVGAVRAGANAAPLPDPWLIDVSRPGARCVREGEQPVWWRPDARSDQPFSVFPIDRSWRADFQWKAGVDRMEAPSIEKLKGVNFFVIRLEGQENAISLQLIPREVTDPLVLASWMLERTCIQQADAYLRQVQATLGQQQGSAAAAGTHLPKSAGSKGGNSRGSNR